jgi:hypothetical protein
MAMPAQGYNHRMQNEIVARTSLDRLLAYWWVILFCMIGGAAIGWLVHLSQPALFESRSTISTSINYSETGFMTDLEEDHALSGIGDILLSDAVISKLQDSMSDNTRQSIGNDLLSHLFTEREGYRWVLRVQAGNADVAREVNQLWVDAAMQNLQTGLIHARQALLIHRQIADLENCFSESVSAIPSYPPCDFPSSHAVRQELEKLGSLYASENSLSEGILPALTFSIMEAANSSGAPVTFERAEMVFSGAIMGFLAGVIMVLAGFPKGSLKALSGAE